MNKKIKIQLNKFPQVPNKLRENSPSNIVKDEVTIKLSRLYYHYYLDFWGIIQSHFTYKNSDIFEYLVKSPDFRFHLNGTTINSDHKRIVSYLLGQAFCRYFLYEFCGITYFAHMDKIIDKTTHPAFNGLRIQRALTGDIPDYLCARKVDEPYIAEAKGRFNNINFNSLEFAKWRKQFENIIILDKSGKNCKIKGFIVATKFVTDQNINSNRSTIMAEDPETGGDNIGTRVNGSIGRGCIAIHYSNVAEKLGLPLISQVLGGNIIISENLIIKLPLYKCLHPKLEGQSFISGRRFFGELRWSEFFVRENYIMKKLENSLGVNHPLFFGLHLDTFKFLIKACTVNWNFLSEITPLEDVEDEEENLMLLRDGTVSGNLNLFEFVEQREFRLGEFETI